MCLTLDNFFLFSSKLIASSSVFPICPSLKRKFNKARTLLLIWMPSLAIRKLLSSLFLSNLVLSRLDHRTLRTSRRARPMRRHHCSFSSSRKMALRSRSMCMNLSLVKRWEAAFQREKEQIYLDLKFFNGTTERIHVSELLHKRVGLQAADESKFFWS